jgi:hypothetical protein
VIDRASTVLPERALFLAEARQKIIASSRSDIYESHIAIMVIGDSIQTERDDSISPKIIWP